MTKSGAISALENIEKVLKRVERHPVELPLSGTDIQHRAHRERRNIDDIISFIKKLDRASRA